MKAMILAAPYFHCPFFKGSNSRSRFPGVEDPGVGIFKFFHKSTGLGGNGTHPLHGVEHKAFALQDGLRRPLHIKSHVSSLYPGPVL